MTAHVRRQAGKLEVDAKLACLADHLHAVDHRDWERRRLARYLIESRQRELQRAFRLRRDDLLANEAGAAD